MNASESSLGCKEEEEAGPLPPSPLPFGDPGPAEGARGGYTHGAEQLDAVSTEHSAHPPTDTREPDTACGIEPSHPRNAPVYYIGFLDDLRNAVLSDTKHECPEVPGKGQMMMRAEPHKAQVASGSCPSWTCRADGQGPLPSHGCFQMAQEQPGDVSCSESSSLPTPGEPDSCAAKPMRCAVQQQPHCICRAAQPSSQLLPSAVQLFLRNRNFRLLHQELSSLSYIFQLRLPNTRYDVWLNRKQSSGKMSNTTALQNTAKKRGALQQRNNPTEQYGLGNNVERCNRILNEELTLARFLTEFMMSNKELCFRDSEDFQEI
ncbi:hypothetical protein Anapl_01436 [Anas platyrhynchos]|uniref:Uncharacterized protein n=1 Tax=Anas platyrhynchos TaxID=8839 RepID=R0LVL9_ANAPL|nr:hypothetical protein Anapl_01436 [Anas platyrhynchos]